MEKTLKRPLVSIIIVNYNAGDLLLQCVESIFKSNYDNFEVIVVDNASSDNSHNRCKEKFEKIRLIVNKENLGFCQANNIGITEAKGKFIVLLNPDTVVEKSWLEELIWAYRNFEEGLYQPKILYGTKPNIFNTAGNMINIFGFSSSRGINQVDTGQFEKPATIGYPSGACLFTSREVLNKIGLLDPFLFAYYDDMDLGWRAAMQGIKSYYVPKSLVYHFESYSFKNVGWKYYLGERNRLYCLLTHYSRSTSLKILPSLILIEIAMLVSYSHRGLLKQKIRAYAAIIKDRKQLFMRYREIQRKRKIEDKEIIKNFRNELALQGETLDYKGKLFNTVFKILGRLSRVVI